MGIASYLSPLRPDRTPQSAPLPGRPEMKENNAGGFAFIVDDWTRLDRFLVLGSEGGTYYATEREHTTQATEGVLRAIEADGVRAVRRIVEISDAGRAPKNDPAIFSLALCARSKNEATRREAYQALPKVCRTGTHLFAFAEAMHATGGWGRGLRKAVARWYTERSNVALARQVTKYRQRGGWSHRDLLRLAHPVTTDATRKVLFDWICRGWPDIGPEAPVDAAHRRVWAFEKAQRSVVGGKIVDEKALVKLIADEQLVREDLPTEALGSRAVWDALLTAGDGMPMTAMVRNLGKMSAVGLLTPLSDAEDFIAKRLADTTALKGSRIHPLGVLFAQRTYAQGHGDKGSLSWVPSQRVIASLECAFLDSFANVAPTGKRHLLGLDVSGSMGSAFIGGSSLSAREASAAMALVTATVEDATFTVGFTGTGQVTNLPIRRGMSLVEAVQAVSALPFGPTDCAAPMVLAYQHKIPADTFVVYTDSETWSGALHPSVALKQYRQMTGIAAKLIVVGMTATEFTIADPQDGGMMDVVGFDAAAPAVMADFARA